MDFRALVFLEAGGVRLHGVCSGDNSFHFIGAIPTRLGRRRLSIGARDLDGGIGHGGAGRVGNLSSNCPGSRLRDCITGVCQNGEQQKDCAERQNHPAQNCLFAEAAQPKKGVWYRKLLSGLRAAA